MFVQHCSFSCDPFYLFNRRRRGLEGTLDFPNTVIVRSIRSIRSIVLCFSNVALGFYLRQQNKGVRNAGSFAADGQQALTHNLGRVPLQKTTAQAQSRLPCVNSLSTDRLWHLKKLCICITLALYPHLPPILHPQPIILRPLPSPSIRTTRTRTLIRRQHPHHK